VTEPKWAMSWMRLWQITTVDMEHYQADKTERPLRAEGIRTYTGRKA